MRKLNNIIEKKSKILGFFASMFIICLVLLNIKSIFREIAYLYDSEDYFLIVFLILVLLTPVILIYHVSKKEISKFFNKNKDNKEDNDKKETLEEFYEKYRYKGPN